MMKCKVTSVYVRGKTNKLYYEFFDIDGKKRQVSTGLDNTKRNVAEAWKRAPEFEERLKEQGLKKRRRNEPRKTFAYYADKYVESLKKSRHTKLSTHSGRVRRLKEHFGGDTLIQNITELDLEEFFMDLDVTLDTKRDWRVVLNKIFEFARKDRAIPINIVQQFKFPESETHYTPEDKRMPYSEEEVRQLINNADRRLRNYLGIAFNLGLRPEEILALREQDIDFETRTVYVRKVLVNGQVKPVTRKKGGERDVPLFDAAVTYIEDQLSWAKEIKSEFLFFNENGEKLYGVGDIRGKKGRQNSWEQYQKRLGIYPVRRLMNTRHTFAIQCIRNMDKLNITVNDIASILGHSTLRMLFQHYGAYLKDKNTKIDRGLTIYEEYGTSTGKSTGTAIY